MVENDEYRGRAAECRLMAKRARNEADKRAWLQLADSWLLMNKFGQNVEQELRDAKRELATLQQKVRAAG
jgi:hypothetical protein